MKLCFFVFFVYSFSCMKSRIIKISTKNFMSFYTKVQDAYLVNPIYFILQGIQLELQTGRTRSDRPR